MENALSSSANPTSSSNPRRNFDARFWLAIVLTGLGTGASAAALMLILQAVQHTVWPGADMTLLDAASQATPWRHVLVLLGAGLATGAGQIILVRLTASNSIDITEAIWFSVGRLPALRTLGSAVLSVIVVGMGASLGREGAPKQAGAVVANVLSDRARLSGEQRRLLVACGAGAGMAAAYGVPLGGALFALEVLRGMLALRLVLPALLASVISAATAWLVLPNAPTYDIPAFTTSVSNLASIFVIGPVAGLVSVGFVRVIAWADRNRPKGWWRLAAPVMALGLLGVVSIAFPQLLGNGKDIAQLAFSDQLPLALLAALLILKPAATVLCLGSGVPGGAGGAAWGERRPCFRFHAARRATRLGCGDGRRRRAGGHHPRPDLGGGTDDGVDRTGPFLHRALDAGGGDCNTALADDRAALDLRCAPDRRRDRGATKNARAGAGMKAAQPTAPWRSRSRAARLVSASFCRGRTKLA
jgi:CIC family chloride channel protein